jgi:hypothetical protein
MAEDWELKSLERRIGSLEASLERDRKRAQEEKEKAREEERSRSKRRSDLIESVLWTLYVAALTTMVVLAATGQLHHH